MPRHMDRKTRDTMIAVAIIALLFFGIHAGVKTYSGHDSPYSTVTSKSMQHEDGRSQLGVIDTGDMVLVRDKSKTQIVSYLEGRSNGYSRFGDYGSVIIYERGEGRNPIIHRALMYVEIVSDEGNKAVKVHHLDKYLDGAGVSLWSCSTGSTDPDSLSGRLTLFNMGYNSKDVIVDLDLIISDNSIGTVGYITKGDNNNDVDQPFISPLVTYEMIESVPVAEIPWLGCLKLVINGKTSIVDKNVPNSLPSLGIVVLSITAIWIAAAWILFLVRRMSLNSRSFNNKDRAGDGGLDSQCLEQLPPPPGDLVDMLLLPQPDNFQQAEDAQQVGPPYPVQQQGSQQGEEQHEQYP